jgi:FkbM family methyltransferase
MTISNVIKELAFSILDKSKFRGFHLFRDLRFYAAKFNLQVDTIFDVGANIGQTSKELRKYFPNTSIHAFEPINSTFDILKENFRNDKKIILNNAAMGSEEKKIKIFLQNESLTNSLLNEVDLEYSDSVSSQTQIIHVLKGDKYFNTNNIDYCFLLKTDTEGYDLDVLKGFEKNLVDRKISFVLSEVTFDRYKTSQTNFYKVNEYLTSHGYELSCFYDLMHKGGFEPTLNYCNCLWSSSAIKK